MALALDGTAVSGTNTGATSVTSSAFTNATAGSIVIASAVMETSTTTGDGYPWTAPSCSGGGLTWHLRKRVLYRSGGTIIGDVELVTFWAYAPSALTSQTITVDWSATGILNFDDTVIAVCAVKGFTGTAYQTNPWDSNVSLPATASNQAGAGSNPTVSGISTTSAASMLLSWVCNIDVQIYGSGSVPTGFTLITEVDNSGGANDAVMANAFNVVTSAQSSITTSWSLGSANWAIITDALAEAGSGAGGATVAGPGRVAPFIFRPRQGPSRGLRTARSTFIPSAALSMPAAAGSFALTGQPAVLNLGLPSAPGSFALTGQAAPEGTGLVSTFGSFIETGEPIAFALGMPTVAGSFALSGQAAPFDIKMPVVAGSFALTGFAAPLATTGDTSMPAAAGSFTLTGEPISFDLAEAAVAGSFALTGNAATLAATSNFTMAAAVGSFALTGEPAPLDTRLGVTFAPFALTGQAVAFDVRMPAAPGAYAATGFDAALSTTGSQSVLAVPGLFNLTGIDVSFLLPSAQPPAGGAGYVMQPHRFTRKRWEELMALIAAEQAVAAKARKVGSPARAEALAKASRTAQDAIFALEDVDDRESYERDMERLRAHLATAAAAKKTVDSICEAQAAAVLAARMAAEVEDEQEMLLLLDN